MRITESKDFRFINHSDSTPIITPVQIQFLMHSTRLVHERNGGNKLKKAPYMREPVCRVLLHIYDVHDAQIVIDLRVSEENITVKKWTNKIANHNKSEVQKSNNTSKYQISNIKMYLRRLLRALYKSIIF